MRGVPDTDFWHWDVEHWRGQLAWPLCLESLAIKISQILAFVSQLSCQLGPRLKLTKKGNRIERGGPEGRNQSYSSLRIEFPKQQAMKASGLREVLFATCKNTGRAALHPLRPGCRIILNFLRWEMVSRWEDGPEGPGATSPTPSGGPGRGGGSRFYAKRTGTSAHLSRSTFYHHGTADRGRHPGWNISPNASQPPWLFILGSTAAMGLIVPRPNYFAKWSLPVDTIFARYSYSPKNYNHD